MTVEEFLGRVSSRELAEWAAFEQQFGPLGLERGDWQAAQIAQVVAGDQKHRLSDWVLSWGQKRRQTGHEQLALLRALASGGGRNEHDREPPDQGRG